MLTELLAFLDELLSYARSATSRSGPCEIRRLSRQPLLLVWDLSRYPL
jgi:hypothetical protein